MTIQDMDISLNISTAPALNKSKKASGYKKEFFKPQFRRQVKKSMRDDKRESETNGVSVRPTQRIRQKSLAAIVGRNSSQTTQKNELEPVAAGKQTVNGPKSNPESNFKEKPIVAFAKSGQETGLKTILARRIESNSNQEKRSLLDIFSKNSQGNSTPAVAPPVVLNLDQSVTDTGEYLKRKCYHSKDSSEAQSTKKIKFNDSRKIDKPGGDKEFGKSGAKIIPGNHSVKPSARTGGTGKISSLFGNNPEIPNMGQRFVKPVDESVFSGTNFVDFDLHPFMISNLEQNMQITKLTTVQQKAIPPILSGHDVLVRSQTGSGKTLAYALPIVEKLHKVRPKLTRESGLRALIVVPTRELALQTYECFLKLIKSFTWIVPGYLVGGEKRKAEKARLRRGCTILVATPGRLLDHIKHTEALRLHDVQCFVLDEADRMLDMGYEKDVSEIVSALEKQKNMPRFGAIRPRTTQIENNNSGYNPLEMLRKNNTKKIFTDEDLAVDSTEIEPSKTIGTSGIEETFGSKGPNVIRKERDDIGNVDVGKGVQSSNVIVPEVYDEEEDEEDDEDDLTIKRAYHSGTDSDSDQARQDFPIRMPKNKKLKRSAPVRDERKLIASWHKINRPVESDANNESSDDEKQINSGETDSKADAKLPENSSENENRRQTVLLSATLTQAVEKLAGLTMNNPIIVDAAKENLKKSGGSISEINEDLIVPQSVAQSYVVTPPKLRLVSLSAYIAGKCQAAGQHKTLVFMATQDMVDYHADILTSILCKPSDEDDDDSEPLVDVEFFKLHGNMTQKERTEVFKTFRASKSGVLLCTDVAARGLDLPKVDSVVQYTGPLSARDYVHRVGRTARAGSSGSAVIFLTPAEVSFVRMLESRRVRIQQEDMNSILGKLLGPLSARNNVEAAATALQNQFENLVLEDKEIHKKACKAYVSWIRFYASYPKDMREMFDRRELHLGHFAKSFGLRDPPQRIGGIGKTLEENDDKKVHNNRLSNERPKKVFAKKKDGGSRPGTKPGSLKKVRMLNTSEYGSGLEKAKKQKKFRST